MDLGDAAPQGGSPLHLARQVGEEEHLAVAGAGEEGILGVARVLDEETRVPDAAFAAEPLQVALPALAVGRIGEHEVELVGREGVVRQRRMLRPADDVVRLLALALEQRVGLAHGVGLGVDLLAVEMDLHLLAMGLRQPLQGLLCDGEHAAGAAGPVVEQVGAGLDALGDGQDHIPVLAADIEVPQDIVGDAPDEVGDPAQLALFHLTPGASVGSRGPRRLPALAGT